MKVLLTNDDGIEGGGLLALEVALRKKGVEVLVAAPAVEQSGSSHSFSLGRHMKVINHGENRYAVTGTPVDTVHLAVNYLFKDNRPDLVISGINCGANMGCDVHYSGTVGAAREAALLHLPAFAISLETFDSVADFGPASIYGANLAMLISDHELPPRTFLNVNVPELPNDSIKGIKVTAQGQRRYEGKIDVDTDEHGDKRYMIGGAVKGGVNIPDSDIVAVEQGYISVTPMQLDHTNNCAMEWLSDQVLIKQPDEPWK